MTAQLKLVVFILFAFLLCFSHQQSPAEDAVDKVKDVAGKAGDLVTPDDGTKDLAGKAGDSVKPDDGKATIGGKDLPVQRPKSRNEYAVEGQTSFGIYSYYQWFGVAPFCVGSCPEGMDEVMTASEEPKEIGGLPNLVVPFGNSCISGSKALCRGMYDNFTPSIYDEKSDEHKTGEHPKDGDKKKGDENQVDCEWYGTAPFCEGVCPPHLKFEREARTKDQGEESQTSGKTLGPFGSACWTGKKALCCKQ
ncbi:unnamed protein product [Notodromas monacha]|uniref:Uncharacterized protein n=1 Tax=Notodromas monacha TaxID=399045 RepID=A0A7R9BRN0_9CRUS|nr:unnamed protein product [Notodromas monacha]CAG0919039.1 unnamed protein product [Notodromas monacha]